MSRTLTRGVLAAVLTLSTCAVVGCSLPGQGAGAAAGQTAGTDAPRLRIAMLQPPRSGLSPYSDDAFKLSRWAVTETLVTLDDAGLPQPGLATAWDRIDETTWEFTLREGVSFHDGSPMDAAQVAASLTAATEATPLPRILDGIQVSAQAVGDRVRVSTGDPDPLLPARLSSPQLPILAAAAYTGPVVSVVGTATGPFRLGAADTARATLDRFDDYWGEQAQSPGLDVTFVSDGAARAAALRTGEADIVEAVPVNQAGLVGGDLVREVPMPRTATLHLTTTGEVFDDPALRGAAAAAIDRDALVSGIYEGHADAAVGLLGPAIPWTTDRERDAQESTPEAGPVPPGTTITLATYSDRPELPEMATTVADQLEAAGFTVEQVVREYAEMENDAQAGEFDAVILSRATVLDSGDPGAYLTSDFTCEGSFNLAQVCDPAIDAAVETATRLDSGPERHRALLAAEAEVLSTGAAIPLLHERVLQGGAAGVVDALYDPRERALVTSRTRVQR